MFGNFSLFKTPFPGRNSVPPSFVSFFVFYIFSYLLSGFSGCLMSSAGIQKLFCGIYSTIKCSFDEFLGEKVFSPSYSSAILAPPPISVLYRAPLCMKCSLGICSFLEEIARLSYSVVFLYFFSLIAEEGFLFSPCYSLELCIQMVISFLCSFVFHFSSVHSYL